MLWLALCQMKDQAWRCNEGGKDKVLAAKQDGIQSGQAEKGGKKECQVGRNIPGGEFIFVYLDIYFLWTHNHPLLSKTLLHYIHLRIIL